MILVVYVTYNGGMFIAGRLSEVFGPIIFLSMVFMLLLLIKDFNIDNMLPILADSELLMIAKATLVPLSLIGESVILLPLIYFVEKPDKVFPYAVSGVLLSTLLSGLVMLSILLTFGPEIAMKMLYPAFDVISYISVLNFIQNLELLAVLITLLSIFMKIVVYFLILCYTTAELLHMKNWKISSIVYAIIFVIASTLIPNISYAFEYFNAFWIKVAFPVYMIGVPLFLFIVQKVKRSVSQLK